MTAIFPPIPRLVFTVLEPISLVAGAVSPVLDLQYFVSSQLPALKAHNVLPTEQVLALQLGNLYGLMCLVGLFVLNTTTEAKVVHAYIWALLIADVGHLAATYWVMGPAGFFDVAGWNAMAMGNIGITALLLALRSLYLMGALGADRIPVSRAKKTR